MLTLPYVEAPPGSSAIELRALQVQARIVGLYAETSQTMAFYNPNERDLEGSLVFPLPEGAVVCGYALETEGHMIEAVVVAKHEARRILEAEIRKGVDPGLVEQVAGNLYRARVYPLPAGNTRRVRVTYLSQLTVAQNDAAYHLPLPHADGLKEVELSLDLTQTPVPPRSEGPLELQHRSERWLMEGTLPTGSPDLHLLLPALPDRFAMVERHPDGEVFFCISLREPEPQGEWHPRRLAVVWDASGSRAGQCALELNLLRLLALRWPDTGADLVVLRDSADPGPSFANLAALADHLETIHYDGATALSQLDFSIAPEPGTDGWLLFSDGLDSVSPGIPRAGALPVLAVTSQAGHNGPLLNYLAQRSQGTYINLLSVPPEQAVERLCRPLPTERGDDLHITRSWGRVAALGRLSPERPWVSFGGVMVELEQARPGTLLARAWAGRQAEELQLRGMGAATVELGRRYGLVTPGSSLLVLESLDQYLEYDLEPPASLPQLRAAFALSRAEKSQEKEAERAQRLDRVAALWAERVAWWEKDHEPSAAQFDRQEARGGPPGVGGILARQAAPMAFAQPVMEYPLEPEVAMEPFAMPCEAAPAPCLSPGPVSLMADLDLNLDLDLELEDGPVAFGAAASPQRAPSAGPSIAIQGWDPQTPYLEALRLAAPEQSYGVYLKARPQYAQSPSFYLDCGDFFLRHERQLEGLRVLSNLLELGLDDPAVMRIYAYRLQQAGELSRAVTVLERVLELRPEEPQSARDLGLVLGDRWQKDGEVADLRRAVELLYSVVQKIWDRFPEIELIALMELNRLLAQGEEHQLPEVDPRLKKLLTLDLRISMAWDADLTDVDLHVTEPTGEHCYYGHRNTAIGGLVSRDFRDGYGPEEYVLKKAPPGSYEVSAHYYSSHQQTLTGPCTVLVHVFTNYGRADEARKIMTLRLEKPHEQVRVGEVNIG